MANRAYIGTGIQGMHALSLWIWSAMWSLQQKKTSLDSKRKRYDEVGITDVIQHVIVVRNLAGDSS